MIKLIVEYKESANKVYKRANELAERRKHEPENYNDLAFREAILRSEYADLLRCVREMEEYLGVNVEDILKGERRAI